MSSCERLWVVMPVYNEEACVTQVIEELLPELRRIEAFSALCIIDDGSSDGTGKVLEKLARFEPRIRVISRRNVGHGQSCIFGYKLALEARADWVLQLDSDGQCDPSYLPEFWEARRASRIVYGFRFARGDGAHRLFFSRILTLLVFLFCGVFVRDLNVPYRLMHRDTLLELVPRIPDTIYMANMLVAVEQIAEQDARWIGIRFRDRIGGTSKQGSLLKLLSRCCEFLLQLRVYRKGRKVLYTRVVPTSKTGSP